MLARTGRPDVDIDTKGEIRGKILAVGEIGEEAYFGVFAAGLLPPRASRAGMAPRYCKKCKVAFHGPTCPAGHPIYLYSKAIPDGVDVPAASPTPDDDDDPDSASPLKPAAQGGAVVHKKASEPASSVDLSTVSSDGKEAQRELDRALALEKTQERMRAALAKKQEPMMVAIDALKKAVAEDSRYKKASAEQKPELVLNVIASYRFSIGLATEVTQSPKAKASVVKQLSEKIESMQARVVKLEATLEEGSEDALEAALGHVRAAAEKEDSEKVDAAVGKRMESWDGRWEQEWVAAHAGGRRGAVTLSRLDSGALAGVPSAGSAAAMEAEEDSDEGFHSVTATPAKPQAEGTPEIREVAAGLREVAAPADVTGDPVEPPPPMPGMRVAESALGPPPSMPSPGRAGNAGTGDLLSAAAMALTDQLQLPAHAVTPEEQPGSGPEDMTRRQMSVAAPAAPTATTTAPARPKLVLSPAPRPRPARVLPAPYTPAPAPTGSLYNVGDARRYLEASGTLAVLSDALYTLAAEPETARPASSDAAVAYLSAKASAHASGVAPPIVERTVTSEVNLVDIVSYDYLSAMAAPAVHAALMRAEKERPTGSDAGAILGELLASSMGGGGGGGIGGGGGDASQQASERPVPAPALDATSTSLAAEAAPDVDESV